MATDNATILGRIYLNGTNDYQQRVPAASAGDIAATQKFLFAPMNKKYYNEFVDQYVNLIGQQIVHNKAWQNPLAAFKGPSLRYGQTIQESALKWVKAHSYNLDEDALSLLKVDRPEAAVWYHSVNRRDRYDMTIERPDLEMAFRDEYGLNRFIDAAIQVPTNSDNYDEYNCMLQLLAYYDEYWGFFTDATAIPTDEDTGKAFLKAVRAYATKLTFPTSLYSPVGAEYGIPTFARPDELVLLVTADVDASLDVDTLASIFNLDKADIKYRKIVVPEFPVAGMYALLTTDAFFVCNDYIYSMESFYNPKVMATNYFLHHWEVVSASPFVPAIAFVDGGTATPVERVTQTVSGVTVTAADDTVEPGGTTQMSVELTGTISPETEGVEVAPDAVTWEITAARSDTPVALNSRTRVDRLGVLHVQKTGLEAGDVLTVTGTTVYVNPSGETTPQTGSDTVTIA